MSYYISLKRGTNPASESYFCISVYNISLCINFIIYDTPVDKQNPRRKKVFNFILIYEGRFRKLRTALSRRLERASAVVVLVKCG